jgi:hypothetical protein
MICIQKGDCHEKKYVFDSNFAVDLRNRTCRKLALLCGQRPLEHPMQSLGVGLHGRPRA